ncbi:MAG: hypothetical protein AB1427_00390 [Thermodesulfobacteriota bacterium]
MKSPIEAFLDWYKSLPVPHRQEIAAFVMQFNPGFEAADAVDLVNLVTGFEEKLGSYTEDKFFGVGVTLVLRASIEFLFMRKRGSRAGWQETRDFLQNAKARFAAEGQDVMAENAEKLLLKIPFKEEQWIVTGEKWKVLLAGEFSDAYIDRWWRRG